MGKKVETFVSQMKRWKDIRNEKLYGPRERTMVEAPKEDKAATKKMDTLAMGKIAPAKAAKK